MQSQVLFPLCEASRKRMVAQEGVPLPFSIVLANKQINSCGLQLADLVARPIGRKQLNPQQENRAYDILEAKFLRNSDGEIEGEGLETYP